MDKPKKIILIITFFVSIAFRGCGQVTYINGHPQYFSFNTTDPKFFNPLIHYFDSIGRNTTSFLIRDAQGIQRPLLFDDAFSTVCARLLSLLKSISDNKMLNLEGTNKGIILPIYNRLKIESEKPSRSQISIDLLGEEIRKIPRCKEQVWLMLEYWDAKKPAYVSGGYIKNILLAADSLAAALPRELDKGWAHIYIGDYASRREMKEEAIYYYYSAHSFFYNADTSDNVKLFLAGTIQERLAAVFQEYTGMESYKKKADYYLSAYLYENASQNNVENGNVAFGKYLYNQSVLTTLHGYLAPDSTALRQVEVNILNQLFLIFNQSVNEPKHQYAETFVYWSIAEILEHYKKYESAKKFYLFAFFTAFLGNEKKVLLACIRDIAVSYSLLGKAEDAVKYANLLFVGSDLSHVHYDEYFAIFTKALTFQILKKTDSAQKYFNRFHTITARDLFEAMSISRLEQTALFNKYNMLSDNHSDSASFYRDRYEAMRAGEINQFTSLVSTEAIAMSRFLDKIKNSELDKELSLTKQQKYQKELIINGSIAALIIIIFAFLRRLQIIEKRKRESDKLQKEEQIRRLHAEKNLSDAKLTLLASDQKEHELRSFMGEVENLIEISYEAVGENPTQVMTYALPMLSQAVAFTKAVNGFISQDYEIAANPLSTIEKEIALGEAFLKVYSIEEELGMGQIQIINNIQDEFMSTKLPIPSRLLNNFIMNAIKHGRKEKNQSITIMLSAEKVESGFILLVDDNGQGINQSLVGKSKGKSTGFALIKAMLDIYNFSNTDYIILFNNFKIIDKSDCEPPASGTIVSLKIIKR